MTGSREGTPRPGSGPAHAAARVARHAATRVWRVTGQVVSASITTADPSTRPASVPSRARAAPARRSPIRSGPGAPVLVIATLMALIIAMLGVERFTGISVLPDRLIAGLRPPPKKFPVLDSSPPVGIAVRTIDLQASVHHVGIAGDGSIGVPDAERAHEVGWYDQGPTPGQYGPAVIVGHVDTRTGPAVFHDLKTLRAGDRIEVAREDRSLAIFEVNSVKRFDKGRLPVDEVFGDFSRPSLRLITCGGRWVGGETGYADNVVVFASLVRAGKV